MKYKIGTLTLLLIAIFVTQFTLLAQEKAEGPHIPLEKNMDPEWVKSLYEKGEQKGYKGDELTHIAIPCGGIGWSTLRLY